jgi:structural maintenance of chromosome 3 (chondroitin sulfate proteoglycan 6)
MLITVHCYFRDIFDKMKGEIRIMKEELSAIERYKVPKEKSLQQCKSSLEAMYATKEGLESELHQDLMEQLSVADQHQVRPPHILNSSFLFNI